MRAVRRPSQLSVWSWPVGPVRLEGEWLVADLSFPRRFYQPMEQPSPVPDFAKIASPRDAIEFAERYGMRGAVPLGVREVREPISEWLREAERFRRMLRQYTLLRAAKETPEARSELLEHWWPEVRRELMDSMGELFQELYPSDLSDDRKLDLISSDLAQSVGAGFERIPLSITALEGFPGTYLYDAEIRSLRVYLYQDLARKLVAAEPLRMCADCGRYFTVGDPRQQYCSEACTNRTRRQRWVRKKKAAAAVTA